MTDYRKRRISAILVPCDDAVEIGDPVEKSIEEWLEAANIKFLSFVNASSSINMSGIIDDDGHQRGLPWNARAQFICGYPTEHPIVGDMIMVSLDWVDGGKDAVSIKPEAISWLKDPIRREEFHAWRTDPAYQDNFRRARLAFPQPTPRFDVRD